MKILNLVHFLECVGFFLISAQHNADARCGEMGKNQDGKSSDEQRSQHRGKNEGWFDTSALRRAIGAS